MCVIVTVNRPIYDYFYFYMIHGEDEFHGEPRRDGHGRRGTTATTYILKVLGVFFS